MKKKYFIHIFDPIIDQNQLNYKYKKVFTNKLKNNFYDVVVLLVSHNYFLKRSFYKKIYQISKKNSLIFDIKHDLRSKLLGKKIIRL